MNEKYCLLEELSIPIGFDSTDLIKINFKVIKAIVTLK